MISMASDEVDIYVVVEIFDRNSNQLKDFVIFLRIRNALILDDRYRQVPCQITMLLLSSVTSIG